MTKTNEDMIKRKKTLEEILRRLIKLDEKSYNDSFGKQVLKCTKEDLAAIDEDYPTLVYASDHDDNMSVAALINTITLTLIDDVLHFNLKSCDLDATVTGVEFRADNKYGGAS